MERIIQLKRSKFVRVAIMAGAITAVAWCTPSLAHFPDTTQFPVIVRPSLRSPGYYFSGYRERYNRPTYIGGKIAYLIAPTSQEALSWHRSVHRGYYANHAPRMEDRYFFPKPWEALTVGPRVPVGVTPPGDDEGDDEKEKSSSKTQPEVDAKDDAATVKSTPEIELVPVPAP